MNVILWILQMTVATKTIATAYSHAFKYSAIYNRPVMIAVSVLLFLCALGLVVRAAFAVPEWITPLAAAILAVLMIIAFVFHLNCPKNPRIIADIILFAMALFIAVGRKFIEPI